MNRALDKTFEDNDKLIEHIKNHNINVTVITFTIHFGWLGRKWDFSRFSFQLRIISGTQVIDSLRTEDSRPGLIGMSPPGKEKQCSTHDYNLTPGWAHHLQKYLGNPDNPSHQPEHVAPFVEPMNFKQRLINTLIYRQLPQPLPSKLFNQIIL